MVSDGTCKLVACVGPSIALFVATPLRDAVRWRTSSTWRTRNSRISQMRFHASEILVTGDVQLELWSRNRPKEDVNDWRLRWQKRSVRLVSLCAGLSRCVQPTETHGRRRRTPCGLPGNFRRDRQRGECASAAPRYGPSKILWQRGGSVELWRLCSEPDTATTSEWIAHSGELRDVQLTVSGRDVLALTVASRRRDSLVVASFAVGKDSTRRQGAHRVADVLATARAQGSGHMILILASGSCAQLGGGWRQGPALPVAFVNLLRRRTDAHLMALSSDADPDTVTLSIRHADAIQICFCSVDFTTRTMRGTWVLDCVEAGSRVMPSAQSQTLLVAPRGSYVVRTANAKIATRRTLRRPWDPSSPSRHRDFEPVPSDRDLLALDFTGPFAHARLSSIKGRHLHGPSKRLLGLSKLSTCTVQIDANARARNLMALHDGKLLIWSLHDDETLPISVVLDGPAPGLELTRRPLSIGRDALGTTVTGDAKICEWWLDDDVGARSMPRLYRRQDGLKACLPAGCQTLVHCGDGRGLVALASRCSRMLFLETAT